LFAFQDALHIPEEWRKQKGGKIKWEGCNDPIYDNYQLTYNKTNEFFQYVIENVQSGKFRFLIYNGDVDTMCNYLGDAWHIRDVAKENNFTAGSRYPWFFSGNNQVGGFAQTYTGTGGKGISITIDVLTVKGAGHMVPNDRPGPSLQMITNFMFLSPNGAVNYTSSQYINPAPDVSPLTGLSPSATFSSVIVILATFFTLYLL
ncbi:serine carboxypeptidase, partial [Oesophagostomum dentatum]